MDADPTPGVGGAVAASQAVFSITVEGDLLTDSNTTRTAAEPLTDWRLVVAPALVVHNLLPVKGTFMVWQKPEVGTAQSGVGLGRVFGVSREDGRSLLLWKCVEHLVGKQECLA